MDVWLEGFLHGPAGLWLVLLVGLLLGLRHASDPDHLAAVTALIASEERRELPSKATLMVLYWGLGHGTALALVGLPLVLLGRYLPGRVQTAAEVAVGAVIVLLAARLLLRWRRGAFHAHPHAHEPGEEHRHLHPHAPDRSHEHAHDTALRTRLSAYGVGLVQGIGVSSGLTLLLFSAIRDPAEATTALFVLASGTTLSMAFLSTPFGLVIAAGPVARSFERVAPILGMLGVAYGLWYALGALGLVIYPF